MVARKQQQDEERDRLLNALTGRQTEEVGARIAALNAKPVAVPNRTYDAKRGVVVDTDTARVLPLDGLPDTGPDASDITYDNDRGVLVDRARGTATAPKGLPPKPASAAQQGAQEQRSVSRTNMLRDDYANEPTVKDVKAMASSIATVRNGLTLGNGVGDLQAIVALTKMFDPGSVAREGEVSLTRNAAGNIPANLKLLVSRWNKTRLLTDDMRAEIAKLADAQESTAIGMLKPLQESYGAQARRSGVAADSAFIAPSPFRDRPAAPSRALPFRPPGG